MDSITMALILSTRGSTRDALSALPDAPTVPHVDKVAAPRRVRAGLASGLHRLADLVAPPARAVRV